MHCRTAALLMGLVLALAAFSDAAPTPLTPDVVQANLRSTGSIESQPQSSFPLGVYANCYEFSYTCYAQASGGSGGYNFTWTPPAYKYYQSNGTSQAMVETPCYGLIQVMVTDSSGATASASAYAPYCYPGEV